MKENSLLLNFAGDNPFFRIVDFLLENKGMDFSKSEIAKGAGFSRASVFNYWQKVEKYGLVRITRSFGKTKLYTLNTKSALVKEIIELEKTLISEAMGQAVISRKKAAVVSNI